MSRAVGESDARSSPGAGQLPATSLIICSRNRPELLLETVHSVLQSTEVPSELVIIDQSDAVHSALEAGLPGARCEIRYIRTQEVGTSRARNAGIAAARHDLLVFTDDDVHVTPEWFGIVVRALLRGGPEVVVTGQVRPADAGRSGGFVPSTIVEPRPLVHRGRIAADVIYPHNLAMYRWAFDRVGPFDHLLGGGAPYPAAEDNDICHRLLEAGYAIHYVPEAVVYHRAWRSRKDYLPLRWAYGRGQGAFYAKHVSLRDPYMLRRLASDLGRRAVRVLRRLPRPYGALGELVYMAGVLSGVTGWLIRRVRRAT